MSRFLEKSILRLKNYNVNNLKVNGLKAGTVHLSEHIFISNEIASSACFLLQARQIHQSNSNLRRFQPRNDPGIKERAAIFKDDQEYLASVQDEEDFAELESDFNNADLSYNEHKRLVRKKKDQMDKMMTVKKFFSSPKAPSMLTWAERLQIKQLHEKDPEEWTIEVLTESFPATREIITKVLESDWTPQNMNKLKKMDEAVRRNWDLLAEDKLEADPQLLVHLKKFLHRREEYLDAIGTMDIDQLFQKQEPKKVWNNGQMSAILESYERKLNLIDQKAKILLEGGQRLSLEAGMQKESNNTADRQAIADRIAFERNFNGADGEDTFKIGGEDRFGNNKLTTLDKLKEKIEMRGDREFMDPLDRVIISSRKPQTPVYRRRNEREIREGEVSDTIGKFGPISNSTGKTPINERLANLAGYSLGLKKEPEVEIIDEAEEEIEIDDDKKEEIEEEIVKEITDEDKREDTFEKQIEEISNEKDRKKEIKAASSRSNFQRVSEFKSCPDEVAARIKEPVELRLPHQNMEEIRTPLYFSNEREREELLVEESSIKGTFFWPGETEGEPKEDSISLKQTEPDSVLDDTKTDLSIGNTSDTSSKKDLVLPTISKNPSQAQLEVRKALSNVPSTKTYPQRIKVPKDKKGKGLTFKVDDCFYDDDGEFLYRVPGMSAHSTSSPVQQV